MANDLDYDFFGIQLQARILVTDGKSTPFDPSDPERPARLLSTPVPDLIRFIYRTLEQITVDEQMGTISSIEVTFTPTYEEALEFLKTSYIKVGNILFLRWGYSKSESQLVTPWKSGLIVAPPRVTLGPISRISFMANGWGHEMARFIKKRQPLKGTYKQVFEQILTDWGFTIGKQFDSTKASDSFLQPVTPLNSAAQSDYDILRHLANDSGNDLIINGSVVRVVSKQKRFESAKKIATFTLFGQMDPSNGNFPMSNFEFRADALFLPPFQKATDSDIVNNDTKTSTAKRQTPEGAGVKAGSAGDDPSKLKSAPVAGGQGLQRAPGSKGGSLPKNPNVRQTETGQDNVQGRHYTPGTSDANLASRNAEVDALAVLQGAFIKVEFDAIGVPFIEPENLVGLRGVGVFEGSYYLTSVSHIIGRGGYDMTCEGINRPSSDALKLLIPPDKNAGTAVAVDSEAQQATNQPAGAGVGSGPLGPAGSFVGKGP